MALRRPRAVLRPGRVSLALIGRKLVWERKFGKFHTSRSRAARDINKGSEAARGQTVNRLRLSATITEREREKERARVTLKLVKTRG